MDKELIITFSYYGIGGAQRRAFALANSFTQKGYKVYILAVMGSDSTITQENYYNINENIKLILAPEYHQNHKNDAITVKYEQKVRNKIRCLKLLQSIFRPFKKFNRKINFFINGLRKSIPLTQFFLSHPDATIINFGFSIFDRVYLASKSSGNKIIYAETNASNKYKTERFYELIRKTIKKSNAFVFQTNEEKAEHGLNASKRAYVIHNPIKPDLPEPYTGIRNKTIVNFCRLSRQKNLLLLIKAFEMLHAEFPDYKLELYADTSDPNNTEYRNELTTYISENNLGNSVFLLPPSSDIHNIIIDCAMFVSSSDYEGISNSMVEAMAIGLPCICTDCDGGGAREMITHGENGLLVPVRDAAALKEAMARMITEDGLAEKCSKKAAEIRETHSIEKISEKWLEIINKM